MDKVIETTLSKAPRKEEGQTGVVGYSLPNGMVLRIEYHTVGKTNVCDGTREVTSEHWDWEKAGCKNNQEWRRYLNRLMWADYRSGLKR